MSLAFDAPEWPPIVFPDGPKAQCKRIIAATAERHGLLFADVIGDRRFAKYVACRQEAASLCARDTTLSLKGIGRIMGKDHSTIIWAIRRFNTATGADIRGMGPITAEMLAGKRAATDRFRQKMSSEQKTWARRMRQSELHRQRAAA